MNPDDFDAIYPGEKGLAAEVDSEGVIRLPLVPRRALLVIPVETFERMLTECYGVGLGRRPLV